MSTKTRVNFVGSPSVFCSRCNDSKPSKGGVYDTFNNGRNRRFVCADCNHYRLERRALTVNQTVAAIASAC